MAQNKYSCIEGNPMKATPMSLPKIPKNALPLNPTNSSYTAPRDPGNVKKG